MILNFKKLFLILIISLSGCSGNSEVDTFTIYKRGLLIQDEYFSVIDVYGFSDNESIARQLTQFLEEEEPDRYYYQLTE